jgi:2,4-dienoyl-CoA reductase-like NADH-dependent reductase (Old Yellow Enzyme family)
MEPLDVSPLFTPFPLKGVTLPNRFVMPGMQRGWCRDGKPLPQMADYYRRRAEGGISLVISEACAIDHPSATAQTPAAWITASTGDAWAHCVEAVHAAGGHMLIQLWHEGAIRKDGGSGLLGMGPALSPSGLIRPGKPNGRAATMDDLLELKAAYVRSALVAQRAGADGVEIHAAHGYMLDQFLWSQTNRRSDGYGGDDIRARVRFPAEIVRAIREVVGPAFILSFRFSQWKEVDYDAKNVRTPDELRLMLGAMRAAGIDIFHASTRRYFVPEWSGSDLGFAGWCKSLTDAPVIAVGSVGLDVDVMDNFFGKEAKPTGEQGLRELVRRFNNGEFDLVSVGRSVIGDPQWVRKVQERRYGDIRPFTKDDLGHIEWDISHIEEAHQPPAASGERAR